MTAGGLLDGLPEALRAVRPREAAARLAGVVRRTPLARFPAPTPGLELRLKLECLQETGAFKARGAWNQVALLPADARARGVVTASSGNHAGALAWAAARAGVPCVVCMPADAYPNKVEACRRHGAEVLLSPTRAEAEAACAERAAAGAVLVPPYDHARTIEGASTVGLELLEDAAGGPGAEPGPEPSAGWPIDVVVVPVGGGGLLAGVALALHAAFAHAPPEGPGRRPRIVGVEPAGAPKMTRALAAGAPVTLARIETTVQGLCPPRVGHLTLAAARALVDRVVTLDDAAILRAQARLVREGGWTVEPAGAAAAALVLEGGLAAALPDLRPTGRPLHVVAIVSGGNPDPAQLAQLRAD